MSFLREKILFIAMLMSAAILGGCAKDDRLVSSCGDNCIEFGRYYSEEDGSPRSIEWLVLDKQKDGTLLLLSKYIIDCMPYNDKLADITWEESSLRKWLNSDFITAAFTHEEQERLITERHENMDAEGKFTNSDLEYAKSWDYDEKTIKNISELISDQENNVWHTSGGNATEDKVWILSINDLAEYGFNTRSQREADPLPILLKNIGDICVAEGANCEKNGAAGNYSWWLRTAGCVQSAAAAVLYDGYIDDDGISVDDKLVGIRPVIKIKLNK